MRSNTCGLVLLVAGCASVESVPADDGNMAHICLADRDCSDGGNDRDAGAADGAVPHIIVMPRSLDFGAPLFDTEVMRMLTIGHTGAPLIISRIAVEDMMSGFSAHPSGDVNMVLAAGASTSITVTLHFTDLAADRGSVVIESNDPITPIVRVLLTSSIIGVPALAVCVLRLGFSDPFGDCEMSRAIDFNLLFGANATRLVTVWNAGTGNQPLDVSDISITDSTGLGDLYTLGLLTSIGTPALLPTRLPTSGGDQPSVYLTVLVTFHATRSGLLPTETLRIESSDAMWPRYDVALGGSVSCPASCSGMICDRCPTSMAP